ncbi:MAG: hypothetical protein K6B52_05020 [Clostridiales bacterium]|nr:hypothetical protein [Clostridiales bacterium]
MSVKRFICVFTLCLFSVCSFIDIARALPSVDAKNMNNGHWDELPVYKLNAPFGDLSCVKSAFIQYYISDSNTVFLRLCATEKTPKPAASTTSAAGGESVKTPGEKNEKISLTVEGETAVFASEKEETFDFDPVTVTGSVYSTVNQINFVARLNFKRGVPSEFDCAAAITDYNGMSSVEKAFTVTTGACETTRLVLTEPTEKTEKSTAEKTTKERTTKEKTTKEKTAAVTTLKQVTTSKREKPAKTEKSPKPSATRRIFVKQNQTAVSKPQKTTKAEKSTGSKSKTASEKATYAVSNAVITEKYIEKETVVSFVAVSQTSVSGDTITLSKSAVYKTAAAVCGIILFALIGIFAVRSGKGDEEDE